MGGDTYINGGKTRIFATYLKEEKPIFELGKKLANYVLIYSHLSKVLVIHFLAGVTTTILITKIAVTQQQQRLCNKE